MMNCCSIEVEDVHTFSDETTYPMVLLKLARTGAADHVVVRGTHIPQSAMRLTDNYSWMVTEDLAKYFAGPKLGDFMVCSSGMTTGNNSLFLREIVDNSILEPYEFEFFQDSITVEKELSRAKYNSLSSTLTSRIRFQEQSGATRRNVRITERREPRRVVLPNEDYRYYNRATPDIIYSLPRYAIYWRDHGDAVITFKRNGPWYLHGVGGKPYFGRSGLTWQLISSRLNVRYLPEGYILVINHTKNIQSKDFERLPYPFWVVHSRRERAIQVVQSLLNTARRGTRIERSCSEVRELNLLYCYQEVEQTTHDWLIHQHEGARQLALF